MEPNIVDTVAFAGAAAATNFSVWGLFVRADIVIKLVMLVLFVASFWSWTIILDKGIRLRRVNAKSSQFEDDFWAGGSLDDLYDRIGEQPEDPMSSVFAAAMGEWRRSSARGLAKSERTRVSLQDRIERVMEVSLTRETERLERYMIFLASAGATAPFIGLFGTVWGIMNSFQSIAGANNSNLATVAPGLAEALFATALGLIVAIPAVIAYNKFTSDIGRYSQRLEGFAAEFGAILSRQLEEAA